jgi:hypothetical protein
MTVISLYRHQRQKEQERCEAEQQGKLEEIVQTAEFLVTKLEQHLAGERIRASNKKEAIGFPQFHLQRLQRYFSRELGTSSKDSLNTRPGACEGILRKVGKP